ncbi:hypothetical protein F511_47556 [Dorcoceras hygrometricum]|uniref:Uncharacterized protein n=1 Tax=Dorcoceras hygrometricum TaxID=472368 RepID=A0A2Z6ZRA9_9LAMI|nr:hypothetical protein F511_47556 [Dorcoceras hygrometricum]
MTSALLIERYRDSATMTSSYMLEEAMSSRDDVSNQQLSKEAQELGSATMTSAYLLEEAMSSRDDVSNQQLSQSYQQLSRVAQELDSAIITSVVSSSHSAGSYSDQQFVYRAVNSLCIEE